MLKFHKKLKFESLHCSLQAVWTVTINTISVSSHEALPRKVRARCSPATRAAPNPSPQPMASSAGRTEQHEGDRRAVDVITKGKFITKHNRIVV